MVKHGLDDGVAHGLESVQIAECVDRAQPIAARLRVFLRVDSHTGPVFVVAHVEDLVGHDHSIARSEAAGDPSRHVQPLLHEELGVRAGASGGEQLLHDDVHIQVGRLVHLLAHVAECFQAGVIVELIDSVCIPEPPLLAQQLQFRDGVRFRTLRRKRG